MRPGQRPEHTVSQVKQILDQYRLDTVLKTTVRTTVFRAVDPRTDQKVAIKLISPAGPVAEEANRTRFLQVLQSVQSGSVRSLARVLDFGFTPDHHGFVVTELVEPATPLGSLAGAPPSQLVSALVSVLDAVDELALAGIAHLNLAPDNVLIVDQAPRIVGLGTPHYLLGAASGVWPEEGARYVAPELYGRGVLRRDDLWLADLYSLTLMACDLLGFEVDDVGTSAPTVRTRGTADEGAHKLESVAAVALRADPSARTASVSELRRALVKGVFVGVEREVAAPAHEPKVPDETLRIHLPSVAPEAAKRTVMMERPAEVGTKTVVEPLAAPPSADEVSAEDPTKPSQGPPTVPVKLPPAETAPPPTELPVAAEPDPEAETRPRAPKVQLPPVPWRLLGVVAAAMVALVAVSLLSMVIRSRTARQVAAQPTPAVLPTPTVVPTPVPVREVVPAVRPLLEQVQERLAEGDVEGARAALEALSEDEIDAFDTAELAIYESALAAVGGGDVEAALKDLRGGLQAGSIRMLRRGLSGLSDLSADQVRAEPGLAEELEHARDALRTHERLWAAKRAGQHLAVLEQARTMITLLPDYSGSYSLRDEAAGAIVGEAEAEIAVRDLDGAVALLEGILRLWPDREGVVERIEWCRQQQTTDQRMASVLERALAAGTRGDPEEGLRVLAGTKPSPAFEERFAAARAGLNEQLAALDAQPPEVQIPEGLELEFRKNETVTLVISVADDYRVERVVVFLKAESDPAYREIELEPTEPGTYRLDITPELHGKGTVLFYVVATDRSGHQGTLGSVGEPLVLKRKRWYQR